MAWALLYLCKSQSKGDIAMNLLQKFRLTKLLYDQVESSGEEIPGVLGVWDEQTYKGLCEYVSQCQNVVPKYVSRLSQLTGATTYEVIHEIVGAQGLVKARRGRPVSTEPVGMTYLPDDATEHDLFLKSIVGDRKRFM